MIFAFAFIATILVGYDLAVTQRRIRKYGIASELNQLTRFLCTKVGVLNGTLAGIVVPHVLFSLMALQYGWVTAYAIYFGWLAKQFGLTLASLPVERELDELRARKADPPRPSGDA